MVLHARAARPARLVRSRRCSTPLQCLGWAIFELLDHRDRGGGALRRALRLPRAVALDAPLRRRRARARAARPDRRSSASSSASSRSGPCSRRSLYLTWWALDGADLGALWDAAGRGRALGLAGRRPRRRDHGLVDPARRRLHALLARPRAARSGAPGSATSSPSAWLLAARRDALLLARRRPTRPRCRPPSPPAGSRATLALLALTVDETDEAFANVYSAAVSIAEPRCRALPQRALIVVVAARRDGRRARRSTSSRATRASCSCSARSSCRSSACCSRTGSRRGAHYSEQDVFGGAGVRGRA